MYTKVSRPPFSATHVDHGLNSVTSSTCNIDRHSISTVLNKRHTLPHNVLVSYSLKGSEGQFSGLVECLYTPSLAYWLLFTARSVFLCLLKCQPSNLTCTCTCSCYCYCTVQIYLVLLPPRHQHFSALICICYCIRV